jgi:hypothetical protein
MLKYLEKLLTTGVGLELQHRAGRLAVAEAVIDLVAETIRMPRSRQTAAMAASSSAAMIGAGRIGRAGDDDAGRGGLQRCQVRGGQLEAALGPAGDLDRDQVQGLQRVAIGDVAGPGQGDAVAGPEVEARASTRAGEAPQVRMIRSGSTFTPCLSS